MLWLRRIVMLTAAALAAAAPLLAIPELTPDELERNRRDLEKVKARPKDYARLRHELRELLSSPPEVQERIRRLDQALYREPKPTRDHLFEVMERYVDWLDQLPLEERRQVREAPDRNRRLAVIKRLREKQWVARLPRAWRQQIARARGKKRRKLIDDLRRRERQRQRAWNLAFKNWDRLVNRPPGFRLNTMPPQLQAWVKNHLMPRLNPNERQRLERARDKPQQFPRLLVRLADKHPWALPGRFGPTHFTDLPQPVQNRLAGVNQRLQNLPPEAEQKAPLQWKLRKRLKQVEGKWPVYGSFWARVAWGSKIWLPVEWWPTQERDLSPPVQHFLKVQLVPRLTEAEKAQLKKAEGKWPPYPRTIQELARRKKLRVPWKTLPGKPGFWNPYRARPKANKVTRKGRPGPRRRPRKFARAGQDVK
jgi:hypothetical protein